MPLLYHAYVYLEFLILACTIYILAPDLEIDYSEIETIEYRKNLDVGVRTSGFGSPKLSMGIFQNDEFGSYTLYSYTGAKEHIILTSGEKTLVIGMSDPKETQAIYDAMLEKVDK